MHARSNRIRTCCGAVLLGWALALGVCISEAAAQSPIGISSIDELQLIGNHPDYPLDGDYVLTQDIDASGTADWNDGAGFEPIGEYDWQQPELAFTGTFDGQGHVVTDLFLDRPDADQVGLFGRIGEDGMIHHLGLEAASVTGAASPTGSTNVGGLVGRNEGAVSHCRVAAVVTGTAASAHDIVYVGGLAGYNGGTVSESYATGAVTGDRYVGGLAGYNGGTVSESYATGAVEGTGYSFWLGGLVGDNSGTVSQSYATGAVTGESSVGGLVGANSYGTVSDCYATGAVTGSGDYVGGLVGSNHYGTVSQCYATGAVTGERTVGGLVGNSYGTVSLSYATGAVTGERTVGGLVGQNMGSGYGGVVAQCYATGSVEGYESLGGLVGRSEEATVSQCYAIGPVCAIGPVEGHPYGYVGGLIGHSKGRDVSHIRLALASFWDVDASGQAGSSGGKGLTTAQMTTRSIFANAGWGASSWVMAEGVYPRLAWERPGAGPIPEAAPLPLAGRGTEDEPYLVATPGEFALLSWHTAVLEAHIELGCHLDCSGVLLYPIGDLGPFTGVFHGRGHVIRNAAIHQPESDYVGVFAAAGESAQIVDICLQSLSVSGRECVGGLVGANMPDGWISQCHAAGAVEAGWRVGGLTGWNGGTVSDCCVTGNVTARQDWWPEDSYLFPRSGDTGGGLVGFNSGLVSQCDATGAVAGERYVGGLVGRNGSSTQRGVVSQCYASVTVTGEWGIGGLVGWNDDEVLQCCATGAVEGGGPVGGLVGLNHGGISECYATGAVTAEWDAGGLVGGNEGDISECYATGAVTGGWDAGGLVGNNQGGISECYATGAVEGGGSLGGLVGWNLDEFHGTVESSFWDIDTSKISDSDGGAGLPTAQMQTESTFTDAGWDFAAVWFMLIGGSYPYLLQLPFPQHQIPVPDVVGMAQAEAETALADAGLIVGAVSDQYSDAAPEGHVLSQAPAAGTEVAPGSAVDLVVSLGPLDFGIAQMDRLVGLSLGGNVLTLEVEGLTADCMVYVGEKPGFVLEQSDVEGGVLVVETPSQWPGAYEVRLVDAVSGQEHVYRAPFHYTGNPFEEGVDQFPGGMRLVRDTPSGVSTAGGSMPLQGGALQPLDYETPEGVAIHVPVEALPENATRAYVVARSAGSLADLFEPGVSVPDGRRPCSPYVDVHILVELDGNGQALELETAEHLPVVLRFPLRHMQGVEDDLDVGMMATHLDEMLQPLLPGDPAQILPVHSLETFDDEGRAVVEAGHFTTYGVLGPLSFGDINRDGLVNAVDVQLVINAVLGLDIWPHEADVNGDDAVNAVDVQLVINAALGIL